MQGVRPDGPAPIYRDPTARSSLMALLEDGFPGLPAGIDRAAEQGFSWADVTEPFVVQEPDGRVVAHAGILEHRVCLMGDVHLVAGMHAVVTASDRRRQGLSRRVQEAALAWVDARYDLCKLSTDDPPVYEGQGFRVVSEHRARLRRAGGHGGARPFTDADRDAFLALCPHRDPVSHTFASLDPGWLVGIDLALQKRSLHDLVVLDALGAVVDWTLRDGVLELHDVFAETLPELDAILRFAPAHEEVLLCFGADRLAPDAELEAVAGGFMVRGRWPVDAAFAVPRLAEH